MILSYLYWKKSHHSKWSLRSHDIVQHFECWEAYYSWHWTSHKVFSWGLVKGKVQKHMLLQHRLYYNKPVSNCPRIHCRQIALMEGGGWWGKGHSSIGHKRLKYSVLFWLFQSYFVNSIFHILWCCFTLKQLGNFINNVISVSHFVQCECNIVVWDWLTAVNTKVFYVTFVYFMLSMSDNSPCGYCYLLTVPNVK